MGLAAPLLKKEISPGKRRTGARTPLRPGREAPSPAAAVAAQWEGVPGPGAAAASYENIIGASPAMQAVFSLISRVGRRGASVLITGESGTGKELVARALHSAGGAGRPFVAINCGALPENLLESELFGHEKGAFTGAVTRKAGKAELASGGTLFLDEIACMAFPLQVKLLRFLQEREFTRLGGTTLLKADLRIIAASNVNLLEAVKRGEFREDLYYRLNVVPIVVPPLRERRGDIPLLARHFLEKYSARYSMHVEGLAPQAMSALVAYDWPGNVRELENIIERLVVLYRGAGPIQAADLPAEVLSSVNARHDMPPDAPLPESRDYKSALQAFERAYISEVLMKTCWNRTLAARIMGVHRNTLLMKMKSLGIREEANS